MRRGIGGPTRTAAALCAVVFVVGGGFFASEGLADGPPAGATALCRDGTYSFSQTHSGTCSHHGGVAQWLDSGTPTTTAAAAPTATTTTAAPQAATTTCNSGYARAVIGGAQKCLRAGEFCTHAFDGQYRRYGFRCTRYDANVERYRLTHA